MLSFRLFCFPVRYAAISHHTSSVVVVVVVALSVVIILKLSFVS